MASITIKKNGATVSYNLSYLDYEKAVAANTANSGSTDLSSLAYVTGNILAAGTLQNIPTGAESSFYVFKCESLPAGVLLSTPAGAVHEDAANVMYLGVNNQSGAKYMDFFSPLADDVKPSPNQVIDPYDMIQKNYYQQYNPATQSYLFPVPKAGSSGAIAGYMWNQHGTALFETENGGQFGAYCGAFPATGGTAFGIAVHSFNSLDYYGPSNNASAKVTGNQPCNFVSGYDSMPYSPAYEGQYIIPYPSNGVDWTAHNISDTAWDATDADGKIYFQCSAEFVVTSINGKLFAGLASCHWSALGRVDKMQVMLLPAWFWGAGSMDLTFDFEIPDFNDTWYGPDSTPSTGGEGGYIVRQNAAQIADVPHKSYFSYIGQGSAGTHCYLINGQALAKLQSALWSSLVNDEFKQYVLSCIVALHQMPQELMPTPNASNAVSSVMIGNIPVPISGGAKAQIIDPFVSAFKVGTFAYNDKYQSLAYFNGGRYLDYEPHVSVTLFLPFAGTLQLSASQCIGGTIEIYVASNASNGDLVYTVVTTSDGKILKDANGDPVTNTYYIAGNSALPVMITGTTTGQKQRTSDVYSAIGGAVSVVTGAASRNVGTIAGGVLGIMEATNDLDHIQQNAISAGGIAGSVAGIGNKQIILRVTRPVKAFDKNWLTLGGTRSEMHGKLSDAKTEDSSAFTIVKYCNTSTLKATDAEKAELLALLQGGVYL